jgi:hypothetical protein
MTVVISKEKEILPFFHEKQLAQNVTFVAQIKTSLT